MTDVLDEAIGAVRFANGQTGNVHFVATIMKAVARGELIRATPEALAASPEVQALMQPDADLLLDAYRALLVLHRVLDKAGLTRGAETAENIADRIVAAHPEIPARSAIRALAPEDAIAEVARIRQNAEATNGVWQANLRLIAERDRLAAELAAANAREAGLRDFIGDFANAKIDALRYQPSYGESPEDEPDPVVDAETVWAWQADAKAALSAAQPAGMAGKGE